MEPGIDSVGVSSNKVWWVLVLFTGPPCVFMCACPGVTLILIDFLLGCWMHRWTFSKDFCPSNTLFQHQCGLSEKDQRTWNKACHMIHPGLFGCVNLSTQQVSVWWSSQIGLCFCKGMEPRSEFKLWKFEEKLLMHLKSQHLRLKFLCLVFSEPSGPRRIPLRGPPMILFSVVCICWFDNPVILPSEGDSGSANTQQRGELLDCDGAHCSSQTMSSLWCLWCLAGRGKFLQSVLEPPNPSVYPPFLPPLN